MIKTSIHKQKPVKFTPKPVHILFCDRKEQRECSYEYKKHSALGTAL